jgi:hypothetical protein
LVGKQQTFATFAAICTAVELSVARMLPCIQMLAAKKAAIKAAYIILKHF